MILSRKFDSITWYPNASECFSLFQRKYAAYQQVCCSFFTSVENIIGSPYPSVRSSARPIYISETTQRISTEFGLEGTTPKFDGVIYFATLCSIIIYASHMTWNTDLVEIRNVPGYGVYVTKHWGKLFVLLCTLISYLELMTVCTVVSLLLIDFQVSENSFKFNIIWQT